jgi:hypothetical protein
LLAHIVPDTFVAKVDAPNMYKQSMMLMDLDCMSPILCCHHHIHYPHHSDPSCLHKNHTMNSPRVQSHLILCHNLLTHWHMENTMLLTLTSTWMLNFSTSIWIICHLGPMLTSAKR